MSVTNKVLIDAKYAASSAATEYTAPALTTTIIDKFTATNTDSSARTITVYLVPTGQVAGAAYTVTAALSIGIGESIDLPEMKNHVLEAGDFISVVGEVASKIVIRASGREVA